METLKSESFPDVNLVIYWWWYYHYHHVCLIGLSVSLGYYFRNYTIAFSSLSILFVILVDVSCWVLQRRFLGLVQCSPGLYGWLVIQVVEALEFLSLFDMLFLIKINPMAPAFVWIVAVRIFFSFINDNSGCRCYSCFVYHIQDRIHPYFVLCISHINECGTCSSICLLIAFVFYVCLFSIFLWSVVDLLGFLPFLLLFGLFPIGLVLLFIIFANNFPVDLLQCDAPFVFSCPHAMRFCFHSAILLEFTSSSFLTHPGV